jgi:uncharacterized membrane protein YtjA (UPF0391 family)
MTGFNHLFLDFAPRSPIYLTLKGACFMLQWALSFLIIAIIAGLFGFLGVAGTAVEIAKIIFFVFLVLFVVSLITGAVRQPPA